MRKAIREFLIYEALVAITMIARYFVVNDIEWGYFWLCVVYFPTVFLFQPVFGLLLGYRAIKKYNIPCLRFLALSLLFFLINGFTFSILSIGSAYTYGFIDAFWNTGLIYACIFIAFYWLSYFITKFYLKFYF